MSFHRSTSVPTSNQAACGHDTIRGMFSDPVIFDALLLALVWLGYFLIHSLLAGLGIKRWVAATRPALMPWYRLAYNGLSMGLLVVPVGLLYLGHARPVWAFNGIWAWLANGLALAAVGGFLYSLRFYDGEEFMGLRQLRERHTRVEDLEHFQLSPLHRFVRHPWYALALVMVWTRDMNSLMLTSAVMITLYFIIGSRLEERKLICYYGDVYRQYRQRVPGLLPLPWRFLTKADTDALIRQYGRQT